PHRVPLLSPRCCIIYSYIYRYTYIFTELSFEVVVLVFDRSKGLKMTNHIVGQFGDTTLTKVFVGGLAWETRLDAITDHFHKYGEILEAVIISDKSTGRSKGYGFVTFKDPEAAKKACEDATPIISGRRANCNLASLGARRPRSASSPTPPPPLQGSKVGARPASPSHASHVQWYHHPARTPPPLQFQHHQPQPATFYGYPMQPYLGTDTSLYDHKLGYGCGSYVNGGHILGQVYAGGQAIVSANPLVPMYPLYQHHQSQTMMGIPAARMIYSPPIGAPIPIVQALVPSRHAPIATTPGGDDGSGVKQ
ncbi:probable RNA-binding protein ARP1, partial [Diospyros lotus]|uniref:probable RNA-binding protein ARP1 n=1 Tax=Diospyros lotus TaxID=55363 RepID=UPI00225169E6